MTWERDNYVLSADREAQDVDKILGLLGKTYWASGRTREEMKKIMKHSLCFSLYKGDKLVGFVRIISDFTKMSWVCDMVVADDCRGEGLGYWIMNMVMSHPELKGTQFALQTKDAHSFYEKLGFLSRPSLMSTAISFL